jgi:hypothetical protein
MDEKNIRVDIAEMFYELGFIPWHPPDLKPLFRKDNEVKPKEDEVDQEDFPITRKKKMMGRIDLILGNPAGETVLCETKRIVMKDGPRMGHNGTLYFSDISKDQRDTLDRWCYGMLGTGFLGLGTIETKEKRRLWVIPWNEWVQVEIEYTEKYQAKGLTVFPYQEAPGIYEEFMPFECIKITGGWEFQAGHPALKIKTFPHQEDEWKAISPRYS